MLAVANGNLELVRKLLKDADQRLGAQDKVVTKSKCNIHL